MVIKSKTRKATEYQMSQEESREAFKSGRYRGACLAETMGPNWKDIYWTAANRPLVRI